MIPLFIIGTTMAYYKLIFQGQIIDSASLDSSSLQQRKNNILRLFNADAEKAGILFSGKPIVIKKNLDADAAKKYISVLKKAGALVRAEKIQVIEQRDHASDNTSETHFSGNIQTPSSSPVSSVSSAELSSGLSALLNYNQHAQPTHSEPQTQTRVSSTENNTGNASEVLQELHLAPNGTDFSDLKKPVASVTIADISHINLSQARTGSLQKFTKKVSPVKIADISSLSMSEAQQGTLEGIEHRPEPAALPDISHLKFSSE